MMITYIVRSEVDGAVKIGTTRNLRTRLGQISTAKAAPLTVLRLVPGGIAVEGWIKTNFRAQRIRGEWFRLCPEMLSCVVPDDVSQNCIGGFGNGEPIPDKRAPVVVGETIESRKAVAWRLDRRRRLTAGATPAPAPDGRG